MWGCDPWRLGASLRLLKDIVSAAQHHNNPVPSSSTWFPSVQSQKGGGTAPHQEHEPRRAVLYVLLHSCQTSYYQLRNEALAIFSLFSWRSCQVMASLSNSLCKVAADWLLFGKEVKISKDFPRLFWPLRSHPRTVG